MKAAKSNLRWFLLHCLNKEIKERQHQIMFSEVATTDRCTAPAAEGPLEPDSLGPLQPHPQKHALQFPGAVCSRGTVLRRAT